MSYWWLPGGYQQPARLLQSDCRDGAGLV